MASSRKTPFHEAVAARVIAALKAGTAPWQRPWEAGSLTASEPYNPISGKRYRGVNTLNLRMIGRQDPRWMTYRQAVSIDAQVQKGERGSRIQYWKFDDERVRRGADGKPVKDARGQSIKQRFKLERPRPFYATVFNAEQIDGLPPLEPREVTRHEWTSIERAEDILKHSGATILHEDRGRAFYSSVNDKITLPLRIQFRDAEGYYAVALHELGHWTGHTSRLNRDLAHPFGSEGYAREELRAEIASLMLGGELGLGHDPGNHMAYVQSWVKVLEEDPLEVLRAASDAEKISTFVMAFEQTQQLAHDRDTLQIPEEQTPMLQVTEIAKLDADGVTLTSFDGLPLADRWTGLAIDSAGEYHSIGVRDGKRSARGLRTKVEGLAIHRHVSHMLTDSLLSRHASANAAEIYRLAEIRGSGRESEFTAAIEHAVDVVLPPGWDGTAQAIGCVEVDGQTVPLPAETKLEAEYWTLSLGCEGEAAALHDIRMEREGALTLAGMVTLIGAIGTVDDRARAVALLSIEETQLRRSDASPDAITFASKAVEEARADAVLDEAGWARKLEGLSSVRSSVVENDARTYIAVPFDEKDEAKAMGALWDRGEKSWYIPAGGAVDALARWPTRDIGADLQEQKAGDGAIAERRYLAVPYEERAEAKALGARWDVVAKRWYADERSDSSTLARWPVDTLAGSSEAATAPDKEFADVLSDMGFMLSGDHPVMDGQPHRVAVEGDRPTEVGGFYVGHLDGHPAGYAMNNRTGEERRWKSKGYYLSSADRSDLAATAQRNVEARQAERAELLEATAVRVSEQAARLVEPGSSTPYLALKGVSRHAGVLTNREGETTFVPAIDVNGKQWSTQYIDALGSKRFAKNSRKDGCFHPVGGYDVLQNADVVVVAEGYATAASIREATGVATVAAFDSGNLASVVRALHERWPDKGIVVAGDDDRHRPDNPGRHKAEEAAQIAGTKAVFPSFAPDERSREPRLTDYNDLMSLSRLGRDGVRRQLEPSIRAARVRSKALVTERERLRIEQPENVRRRAALHR